MSFLTKKTYKKENKAGATSSSSMDQTLGNFKGSLPYDAQYVGTFQPLLGWRSKTTKDWINNQVGAALNSLQKLIKSESQLLKGTVFKGGFSDPAPELLYNPAYRWMRSALILDEGKFLKDLSEKLALKKVGPQIADTLARFIKTCLQDNQPVINPILEKNAKVLLELLVGLKIVNMPANYFKRALEDRSNHYLKVLNWIARLQLSDGSVSREEELKLSPIGLINLYRHYFYDFGSFLGPSIEHIWVGPCSETELIEIWSQSSYRFTESETSLQITRAEEESVAEAKELSEEMQRKSVQDIKVGVSVEGGYETPIWHVSGSMSMDYGTSLTKDKKTVRKQSRELSSKTSTEMKRSVRLLTRESTEERKESTRRHILKNPGDKPISFEMKRKLRKVGVQAQHLGTQLCWQLIIDEPGNDIGLAELVHIAKPQDFTTTPPPDLAPPSYETITEDFQFRVPFQPKGDADDNDDFTDGVGDGEIEWRFKFTAPSPQPGYRLISVTEKHFQRTDPDHDSPSLWALEYPITNPDKGEFEAQLREVNFEKQPAVLMTVSLTWMVKDEVKNESELKYKEKMEDYEQQKQREAQVAIVEALRERINMSRSVTPRSSKDLRDEERAILYRRALRKLLGPELTGSALHATSDLIRTFYEIDKMLYFVAPDWWSPRKAIRRTPSVNEIPFDLDLVSSSFGDMFHVSGFIIRGDPNDDVIHCRYICETISTGEKTDMNDATFPNPKNPNMEKIMVTFDCGFGGEIPNPYYRDLSLASPELLQNIKFGREQEWRANNYLITEDSQPAPLGSSIGWYTQLDGDAHRNAFLNSAWVRIVIPIKRGCEVAAIKWLKQPYVEGDEGLDADLCDENGQKVQKTDDQGNPVTDNNGNPVFKTVAEAIDELMEKLTPLDDDTLYLASQEVYENGFNPLEEGFKPGPDPLEIFAQWIEILPTNQVVPIEYTPTGD